MWAWYMMAPAALQAALYAASEATPCSSQKRERPIARSRPMARPSAMRGWAAGRPASKSGQSAAFDLPAGETAEIQVPELYPDFIPDPVGEPGITGLREIYYTVLCGSGADAYPATGNSPPRIIIPPVQS